MTEEIFGPVLPVFPFRDISEVIKFINARDKPLAVYYFGKPNNINSHRLSRETSSGAYVTNEVITQINSHHTGFGGVGKSGTGRHGGFEGFKCFSNKKGILIKDAAPAVIFKMLVPPYGDRMKNFLKNWGVTLMLTTSDTITFWIRVLVLMIVSALVKIFFF